MVYIVLKEDLENSLKEREQREGIIVRNRDKWILENYGIPEFTEMARKNGILPEDEKTVSALFRHIPSVKLEDLMCFLIATTIDTKPIAYSFYRDRFSCRNWSKRTVIKVRWLENNLIVRGQHLLPKDERKNIEGRILATIPVIRWHQNKRKRVFEEYCVRDVSKFFSECLKISIEAGRYNGIIYIREGNYEKKVSLESLETLDSKDIRPPAQWYYPLYLSLFVCGRMILLETYENVPEFRPVWEITMNEIKRQTGVFPMIVKTPYTINKDHFHSRFLLEYPKRVVEEPEIIRDLEREVMKIKTNNLFKTCKEALLQILTKL